MTSENETHAPMPSKAEWRISAGLMLQYAHGLLRLAHKKHFLDGHYEWESEYGLDIADTRVLHAILGRFLADHDAARAAARAKRANKAEPRQQRRGENGETNG